ncbi:MAG: hypothetical protein PUI92_03065 [Firmicutes bacterium]|nr:hypothetical protein [Bacillota bacterium]MDY6173634.1 hypothetical protein [Lentihominibacter sp.]
MKKTITVIAITLAMIVTLCSCGMDNNTVRPAKLNKGEQEVFDAINGYYTMGQLYEYKTDADELVFRLDKKTKDGWKTVQTKKLKVYPEGYLYVNGDIAEGITISTKTVETKEKDVINVEKHKVKFSKRGKMDMAMWCPEEGYALGQDYITLYTTKNHSIKNTDSNRKKAHVGDYGLMIDTGEH